MRTDPLARYAAAAAKLKNFYLTPAPVSGRFMLSQEGEWLRQDVPTFPFSASQFDQTQSQTQSQTEGPVSPMSEWTLAILRRFEKYPHITYRRRSIHTILRGWYSL